MGEKKNRLFVCSDAVTDGMWWYCGGPDKEDAMTGLKNTLEMAVDCMLSDPNASETIELEIRQLTDDEVKNLPDV